MHMCLENLKLSSKILDVTGTSVSRKEKKLNNYMYLNVFLVL